MRPGGTSTSRFVGNTTLRLDRCWCVGRSRREAGRSAPTISCFTLRTSQSPSSRPRTTPIQSVAGCSRRSPTPRRSMCRSCSRVTATASCSTTALGSPHRLSDSSHWQSFRALPSSGAATASGRDSPTSRRRSFRFHIMTTAAAGSRGITSVSRPSAPSKRSLGDSVASCWSWPRARERPTPRSRSSGGSGRLAQ